MRNRSAAKSAASSPPSPLRISRMTFFLSFGSVGKSRNVDARPRASRALRLELGELFLDELAQLGIGERLLVLSDPLFESRHSLNAWMSGSISLRSLFSLLQLLAVREHRRRAQEILELAEPARDRLELLDGEHAAGA